MNHVGSISTCNLYSDFPSFEDSKRACDPETVQCISNSIILLQLKVDI